MEDFADLDSFVNDKLKTDEELDSKVAQAVVSNDSSSIDKSLEDEYVKVEVDAVVSGDQHSVVAMSKRDAQWELIFSQLKVSGNNQACMVPPISLPQPTLVDRLSSSSMDTMKYQKGMLRIVAWANGLHAKKPS